MNFCHNFFFKEKPAQSTPFSGTGVEHAIEKPLFGGKERFYTVGEKNV